MLWECIRMKKLSNDLQDSRSANFINHSSESITRHIVLFDIDYTIFDTNLFRKNLYPLLAKKIGVLYDQKFIFLVKQIEEECKKSLGHYDSKMFLSKLVKELNTSIAVEDLEKTFWNNKIISDCLYEEVQDVFEKLAEIENISLAIFSTGEVDFQTQKIAAIKKYFKNDHVFIFANKQDKISEIIKIYQGKPIFLVDDSLQILYDAKSINKNVVTVLVKRDSKQEKSEKMHFVPDWEISSLRQIIPIVGRI